MKTPIVLLTALLATFARESLADGIYNTPHDLMVETIRNGAASGLMSGEVARKFDAQFRSTGALMVSARILTRYKQPGCARLAVDYTKKDVPTPRGLSAAHLNTQINYCLDGRAPDSLEAAP